MRVWRSFSTNAASPPAQSFIHCIAGASLLYRMWPPAMSYVNPSTVRLRHRPPTSAPASKTWTEPASSPPSTRKRASERPETPAPRMAIFKALRGVGRAR
jgi:hypothetical protein